MSTDVLFFFSRSALTNILRKKISVCERLQASLQGAAAGEENQGHENELHHSQFMQSYKTSGTQGNSG